METGLPGLRPIRDALKMSIPSLAERARINARFLYRVEAGQQDCTTVKVRAAADVLGCTTDDLLYPPTPQRVSEIRAAYLKRQADEAARECNKGAA